MKIVVCDQNPNILAAVKKYSEIETFEGLIFDSGCEAIVSPANSFGYMTGGIDYAYSQFFGPGLQECLQRLIQIHFQFKELPVGSAIPVPVDRAGFQLMISAPTMRVPSDVSKTINTYLAIRAALSVFYAHSNRVKSIVFPGMGTGCGRVSPEQFARQLKAAIDDIKRPRRCDSLQEEMDYQEWLING